MSAPIAKLTTGKQHNIPYTQITVWEPKPDKSGYPLTISDSFCGDKLPPKKAFAFLKGTGSNMFFTISGPIRRLDENDMPKTRARKIDGVFINGSGSPCNEDLAARENQYVTNKDTDKLIFSDLGSINIENKKSDGSLNKFTLATVKLYSEKESLTIAKKNFLLKSHLQNQKTAKNEGKDTNEIDMLVAEIEESIKNDKKTFGTKNTFFINSGAEFLSSLGFEVRKRVVSNESSMGMN